MIKTIKRKMKINKIAPMILFLLTSGLVIIPMYLRGLYFEIEQLYVYLVSFILFIIVLLYKIKQKKPLKINSYLDYGLMALICIYIISTVFAANYRLSISETLKYINYYLVYLLVKESIDSKKKISQFLNLILIGIIGVSIIGIGAAIGIINYKGAYSELEFEQWINSTLQYHNAFGSIVMCGIFLSYALYINANKIWARIVYSIFGFILALSLIFSYSRGAWLIFAITFIVFIILIRKKSIKGLINLTIITTMPTIIIAKIFRLAIIEKNIQVAQKSLAVGLLICLAISLLLEFIKKYKSKLQYKRKLQVDKRITILIGSISSLILIMLTLIFIRSDYLIKILPHDIIERLKGINLSVGPVKERLVFYIDAIKIIKQSPIIGVGGGGWKSLYFLHQSYPYRSTQAHSYIMQTWMETGTIGLTILITTITAFIIQGWKNLKREFNQDEIYILQTGILMAAVSLLLHSIIDFNLSLTGISIILWSLLSLFTVLANNNKEQLQNKKELIKVKHNKYFIIPITIALLIAISSKLAWLYSQKGLKYANEENAKKAAESFAIAKKLDPLKSAYKYDYANMKFNTLKTEEKKDPKIMGKIEKNIDLAVKLDRYNPDIYKHAGGFYYRNGEIEKGLNLINRSVELQPLIAENYQQMAYGYYRGADMLIDKGYKEKAESLLEEIIALEERIAKVNEKKLTPVILNGETLEIMEHAKALLMDLRGDKR